MKTSYLLPKECREEIEKALEGGEIAIITGSTKSCCTKEVMNTLRWVLSRSPMYSLYTPTTGLESLDISFTSDHNWGNNPGDPARDIIHCYGPCGQTCKGDYETIEPNEYGSWTKICKTCGRRFVHDPARPTSKTSLLNLIVEEPLPPSASTGK